VWRFYGAWVFTGTTNNLSLDALFGGKCDRHLMLVRFITLVLMLAIRSLSFHIPAVNSSSLSTVRIQTPKPATL
jgi:hypothetical protein